MFIVSQYLLNNLNVSKFENISIYAIGLGLVVYAAIYLYFLFYNEEYVSLFNKFIIYIIGIDLLLSSFYYSMNKNSLEYKEIVDEDSDSLSEQMSVDDKEDINEELDHEHLNHHTLQLDDLNVEEEDSNIESDFEVHDEFELNTPSDIGQLVEIPLEIPLETPVEPVEIPLTTPLETRVETRIETLTPSNLSLEISEDIISELVQGESKKRRGRKSAKLQL